MKQTPLPPSSPKASPIKRRGVLLGTGAAALAGVAATVASRAEPDEAAKAEQVAAARQADAADGYRLTDHVKRYYETIRV